MLIASCQCTPLLNLSSLIFGLTSFGWLHCIKLAPISDAHIIFDLRLFDFAHFFRNGEWPSMPCAGLYVCALNILNVRAKPEKLTPSRSTTDITSDGLLHGQNVKY
jgi:hypothetical protein